MNPIATTTALLATALLGFHAEAATLAISNVVSSPNGAVINLDSTGGLDWSVWKQATAGSFANYNVASNTKASSSAISNLFIVGAATTNFRASTSSTPNWDFTYTGGLNSPTSGTTVDANGIFHPTTGTAGNGVGLTVTLPTTGTYTITLYVAGFATSSQLRATLAGVTDPVLNTSFSPGQPDSGGAKPMGYFTVEAQANNPGDVLNLQLTSTTGTDANRHVMIVAAAVQLIPEPSAAMLTALAGGLALARRRRH